MKKYASILFLLISVVANAQKISFFDVRMAGFGYERGYCDTRFQIGDGSYTDLSLSLTNKGQYCLRLNYSFFDETDFRRYKVGKEEQIELFQRGISKTGVSIGGIWWTSAYHSGFYLKPMIGVSYVNWRKQGFDKFDHRLSASLSGEIGYQWKIKRSYFHFGISRSYTLSPDNYMDQWALNCGYSYVIRKASYE